MKITATLLAPPRLLTVMTDPLGRNTPVRVTMLSPTAPAIVTTIAQGVRGLPGTAGASGTVEKSYITAQSIGGHIAVTFNAADGLVPIDVFNLAHASACIGVTAGAAAAGDLCVVIATGSLSHLAWAFAPGLTVLVGPAGVLTQTETPGAVFLQPVGVAVSATLVALTARSSTVH